MDQIQKERDLSQDEQSLTVQEHYDTSPGIPISIPHSHSHRRHRLSLFEKVIIANSVMLVGEALVALWVTSHTLESHHYLIDTSFLIFAALGSLLINVVVLRASFRPLFRLLLTMRSVSAGEIAQRTPVPTDPDIGELTYTFNKMLDQLETFQREQTLHIVQAQEEERRRLARELHDETSQTLTALLIHTEVLSQHVASAASHLTLEEQQQFEREASLLAQLAQGTLDDIRVIAQQLRPSVLDDLGLQAALRWLVEDWRERLRLNVNVVLGEAKTLQLPSVYETTLFRIAQESLTNSARYADATEVSVTVTCKQHEVRLVVSDNGRGFNVAEAHQGLGLLGMRERAALLQGTLNVSTRPGQGTKVEVVLPLSEVANGMQEKGRHHDGTRG